jgi:hypothetical protein
LPLACVGNGITLVDFVTFIFVILAAPWHPDMQFVICSIVRYWDIWVSASDFRLLKRHFRGNTVKYNSIAHTSCFHANDLGRRWVRHLVGSATWLFQECFYIPYVGSSPVVYCRYSSTIYCCRQCQGKSTTSDP